MDELDEFNEATHIVHGDVHPNRTDPHDVDISNQEHHRQRIITEMLDDDDEDIVLSTDDLLRNTGKSNLTEPPMANHNNNNNNHNHHTPRIPNGDLGGDVPNNRKAADWYVNT